MIAGQSHHLPVLLAIDPGATRAGWAILKPGDYPYVGSGVIATPRPKDEPFQEYRLRLAQKWVEETSDLILTHHPDLVVSETLPPTGTNHGAQMYLVNVQIATVHAVAYSYALDVKQVSARTVQKFIAIKGKSKGVTKPQVRNGVLARLPTLRPRFKDFTKVFEESDALAIGLYALDHLLT